MTAVDAVDPRRDEDLVAERLDAFLAAHPPATTGTREFLGAQFDAGLAFIHFPEGYGGLGLSRQLQSFVTDRLRHAGAPQLVGRNPIGYGMAAPTILTVGSEAQRRRYLRPLFTCQEIWCQLFSEPGAGSDVASLATRAVRDGDEWLLTGQKVWTTLAHVSSFGIVLARTDPEAEKHQGITYFVVDMHAPGVDVRPLRQMTGDAEFNEVYFTDVRIPDSERLGPVGDGWRGAIVTLMNERVSIGGALASRGSGPIATAVDIWKHRPEDQKDPARRDRLMRLWIESEVQRLTNARAAASSHLGTPGPEGSTAKLAFAELNKRIYELCLELLGPEGMLYDTYAMRRPEGAGGSGPAQRMFLRSRANSIEGGTSEVMRNILGERVLGLPGDIRTDKGIPWSRVRATNPDSGDPERGEPRPRLTAGGPRFVGVERQNQLGVDHLEPAVEDPLEQLALAPQSPKLQVDVVLGVDHHPDQSGAGIHLDRLDRSPVAAVERIGDLQQGGQPGHPILVARRKASERLEGGLRRTPLVKAAEAGQHRQLVRRKAPQTPVFHQIGGVTLVAFHAHVLADVVHQGSHLEQISVRPIQAVQGGHAVEQRSGQPAHLAGMSFVPSAAAAQPQHRFPAHGPGIPGPLGLGVAADGVENHPLAERPLASD